MKMKRIDFIDRLQVHTNEFRYTVALLEKSFNVHI